MATYLKRFDTTTEYITYMGGDPYLPNVSMCEDIIDSPSMHYTPFIPVSGVTLDKSEASVQVNGSTTLTVTILPLDASKKSVTWTSSDTSKVTIDGTGSTVTLNCIDVGSSTITCTSVSDPSISATCSVTVTAIAVTGITLSSSSKTLNVGSTASLSATIYPVYATNKNVIWTSSDTSKVTVTPDGKYIDYDLYTVAVAKLNFVGVGSSTITCTAESDPSVKATCVCTVNKIAVTGISLDENSLNADLGKGYYLTARISPTDATDKTVTWTSNNESVVRVDRTSQSDRPHIQYGHVICEGEGTANITVTSNDNPNALASCTITVEDRYNVTVTTGEVRYSWQFYGKYVVTDDYGLDFNNIKYNLRFDRDLVEGDKIRIVGKIVDEERLVGTDTQSGIYKSFDMQGTIPTVAPGDTRVLICYDNTSPHLLCMQKLYIGDGSINDLYGDGTSPYLSIDSETPRTGGLSTYLEVYSLEIYVNDVKCNIHY